MFVTYLQWIEAMQDHLVGVAFEVGSMLSCMPFANQLLNGCGSSYICSYAKICDAEVQK